MEKGVAIWLVDISQWNPSPEVFSSALSLLPPLDKSSVLRFVRMVDRKRTLVSRLLQYALLKQLLGIPFHHIIIQRTREGKPYLVCLLVQSIFISSFGSESRTALPQECRRDSVDFPNFNFNASHHEDYVGIASEPLCLVGLDIVSYMPPQNETILEFIQSFTPYFSTSEWDQIMKAGTSDEILVEFYRYWSLKEAFVKATGSGVAFGLDKVEFYHTNWTNIHVMVDGTILPDWKFWLHELGQRHCVAVARGHPRFATESFKRKLKQVEFDTEEYLSSLHLPNAKIVFKTADELISALQS